MHLVLPHQRCSNHSETIIKAVKICVRKGLVVSFSYKMRVKPLCTLFSRHWHYSVHYPLENGELWASYRAPERSTQLNKDQGAPACIPATSLSKAETAEQWCVEKRQKNCTSPSKNSNTEDLMWQKEWDRCSRQFTSTAQFPAQPLCLPSSAGQGSTCSSEYSFIKIWILMGIVSFQSLAQVLHCKCLWGSQIKTFQFDIMHKTATRDHQKAGPVPLIASPDTGCQSTVTLQGRCSANKTTQSLTWWATEHATHVCC